MVDQNRGDMMAARLRQSHEEEESAYVRDVRRNEVFFRHNYLRHLPGERDAPILEIGCGMGQFMAFCRTHGYTDVMGVDLGQDNVEFCRRHGFRAELGDGMEYLQITERTYAAIVMNDVIEHIPKGLIFPLLAGIRERLRPGGVFILKTINQANPIMGCHSRYNDFTHEVGWTEESMRQVLEMASFAPVKVLPSNLFVFYRNPLNYVGLAFTSLFDFCFRLYFRLNGRGTTTVFSKNLIAVAGKP